METKDIYSAKFESLWLTIQNLSKHLGVKLNPKNGELELLRESLDKNSDITNSYSSSDNQKLQTSMQSSGNNQQAELLRENLKVLADKLRIYREIVISYFSFP